LTNLLVTEAVCEFYFAERESAAAVDQARADAKAEAVRRLRG